MILSRFAKAFYCLFFSWGMMVVLVRPLSAQEPSRLVILPELQKYPEIQIKVQCSNLNTDDLSFAVLENGQAITQSLTITPTPRQPTRLGILLDVTPQTVATLPALATAIRNFSDDCVWSEADEIAVWTPAADGQTLSATPLLSWSNDRGDAANKIQSFQPATPKSTKLNQLVEYAIAQFITAENNNILLVLSDGFDDPSVAPAAIHKKATDAGLRLYGVLLPNYPHWQDRTNLQNVVGPERYCELNVSECLNQLWRKLVTPHEYILKYQTRLAPPFTLAVQLQTSQGESKARAFYPILLAVQPVQLQLIDPPFGAIIPITTTATLPEAHNGTPNTDSFIAWFTSLVNLQATTAITRSAITMTQPITAQLAITWPTALPPRELANITYWLNDGPVQTVTVDPRQNTFALPLGKLPQGRHTLHVRVTEAITPLVSLSTTFVEVRDDEFSNAQIEQTKESVSGLKTNLRWLWSAAVLAVVILSILFFLLIRWVIYQANRKIRDHERKSSKAMVQLKADLAYRLLLRPEFSIKDSDAKAELTLTKGENFLAYILIGKKGLELDYDLYGKTQLKPESYALQQCKIEYEQESHQFFVYDGNGEKPSYHGTYVNNQPVLPQQGEKLESGDTIQFGHFEVYTFSILQQKNEKSNTQPASNSSTDSSSSHRGELNR